MIQALPRVTPLFYPLHYKTHYFQAWINPLDTTWIIASIRRFQKKLSILTAQSDNKRICCDFVVYDSSKNPLRNLISVALEDSVLRNAIMALAARHLANQGQSFHQAKITMSSEATKFNHDALSFKHKVIDRLSNAFGSSKQCYKESIVASIFLLILLDLLESGSDEWQFHLKGAKSLITSSFHQSALEKATGAAQQQPTQMIQEMRDFVAQQIML
jgi:hypothetical protein